MSTSYDDEQRLFGCQPLGYTKKKPKREMDTMAENEYGLSSKEVEERIERGEVNADAGIKTRSIGQIFYSNIFTLFNAINLIIAIFVFLTGSYQNMLFMLVIVCNTAIGIFQEIRSKRTTDKLSIIASSQAKVIRDGQRLEIPLDEIVRDDLIILSRGDQVPADSQVISGSCDIDESLLTGESKLINKQKDSQLMSGSFVNAGAVRARVIHVGAENYVAKITAEAKQHKKINSEIMNSLNGIIRFVSILIFPVGAALFLREYLTGVSDINAAILSTAAALVGMIPEGLILLTSTVLAVAVIRLSQSKVLVQQLYCIETLARVDTLCLDKTGTITTGKMEVLDIATLGGEEVTSLGLVVASLANADEYPNETAQAIIDYSRSKKLKTLSANRVIPFSSDKKWSGATLSDGRSFVMGAGQFVLGEGYERVRDKIVSLSGDARVLLVAQVEGFDGEGNILGTPQALGTISIHDQIRSTASQTMEYFKEQGVTLKVISGDDPQTVSGIAQKVGVPHATDFVDATSLKTDSDIEEAISKYSVFGRVRPEQKKAFVIALQKKGHIVAMTGDGVNDTLALKQSDCSIAMAAGSDAARNVSQLVLVDNDFASMPKVVAEGRRSINNLQRSASLFLVKTLMSISLALIFIFLAWQYPFQPIQMTLISAFTIGIPSFVLALEPNKDRIKGKFLINVIVRAIPGALTVVLSVLCLNVVGYSFLGLSYAEVSTLCVLTASFIGVLLIIKLSIPFTPIRVALLIVVIGGTVLGATVFHNLFGIQAFTTPMIVLILAVGACASLFFFWLYQLLDRWHTKRLDALV